MSAPHWTIESDEEYHSDTAYISSTALRKVLQSPAHCRHYLDTPQPDTAAMLLGRALHCAVLEPGSFAERFVEAPEVDRRTKSGKAAWAGFVEASAGKQVLKRDDMTNVHAMRDSLMRHPYGALLQSGYVERSGRYTDPITAIKCRVRPDVWDPAAQTLTDLKTTASGADPGGVSRTIASYTYHVQLAMYAAGIEHIDGIEVERVVIAIVEKTAPFVCGYYELDAAARGEGDKRVRRALAVYRDCMDAGRWPGYNDDGLVSVSLPLWAYGPINGAEK